MNEITVFDIPKWNFKRRIERRRIMKRLKTFFWRWWYRIFKTSSKYTRPEALAIARKYGLEYEIIKAMDHGCTPDEALQEWDIYSFDNATESK